MELYLCSISFSLSTVSSPVLATPPDSPSHTHIHTLLESKDYVAASSLLPCLFWARSDAWVTERPGEREAMPEDPGASLGWGGAAVLRTCRCRKRRCPPCDYRTAPRPETPCGGRLRQSRATLLKAHSLCLLGPGRAWFLPPGSSPSGRGKARPCQPGGGRVLKGFCTRVPRPLRAV